MEVILGKTAGFCFGVENAVKNTEEELSKNKNVYALGELTHNRQVMDKLEKKGLIVKEDIEEIPNNSTVIFRAHGVPPKIYDIAKQKNLNIVDLTCKSVLKIHNVVNDLTSKGNYIFIIGKKEHPEIIGIYGFGGENASIIGKEEDIDQAIVNFQKTGLNKIIIIAQTTFNSEKFKKIVDDIKSSIDSKYEIEVINTICNATVIRQRETDKISKNVDMMIIIGGKNSSNTEKLYNIAKSNCENTIWIETKDEIKEIKNVSKVGIMAGASTPKESIMDVVNYIKEK